MANLFPIPRFRLLDENGDPLVGGKVYFYEAGTLTPKDTFTDEGESSANTNPVILDAEGYADIWGSGSYKVIITDSADVQISSTDNIEITGTVLGAGVVTNANLADMEANTVKVRASSTTGAPSDLAIASSRLVGRGSTGNIAAIEATGGIAFDGTRVVIGGTLGKGVDTTSFFAGTKTSGTFTPDPANGQIQHAVNGGAHTLAPPATVTVITIEYVNNASAGAITTSGFDIVDGDSFTTTDGDKFICDVRRTNTLTQLSVKAAQ